MNALPPSLHLMERLRALGEVDLARMPALAVVLEQLSQEIASRLTAFCGTAASARLDSAVSSERAAANAAPFASMTYKLTTGGLPVVVQFSIDALNRIVDIMFGGNGDEVDVDQDRNLSALEKKVSRRFADAVISATAGTFGGVLADGYEWLRDEVVAMEDATDRGRGLVLCYGVSLQAAAITLQLLVPFDAVKHLKPASDEMTAGATAIVADPMWTDGLHREVTRTSLVVQAALPESSLSLADLASLHVGSIIPLSCSPHSTIDMLCEGRTVFKGRLGQRDGHYTMQIGEADTRDTAYAEVHSQDGISTNVSYDA